MIFLLQLQVLKVQYKITSGGGLTVDGSGNLTTSTSGISAGTYQSITVNNKGVATAGAALTAALIPDLAASKLQVEV